MRDGESDEIRVLEYCPQYSEVVYLGREAISLVKWQ